MLRDTETQASCFVDSFESVELMMVRFDMICTTTWQQRENTRANAWGETQSR
jgi:hypothetical protein